MASSTRRLYSPLVPEQPPEPRGPRLRELGLRIGDLDPGPTDSIADVGGIRVGHITVWRDEPEPPEGRGVARTGVTAIVPAAFETLARSPLPAGTAVLNGMGELTGSIEIADWGQLDTPVYLTATMSVGRVYDGAAAVAVAADPTVGVDRVIVPVVGECDDSWLNDARVPQFEVEDVAHAVESASAWPFAEGAVGAGTGMSCLGWKGGIGTASRVVAERSATVGALVLTNFGTGRQLRVAGVPVGRLLPPGGGRDSPAGSCIVVLATDAPLVPAQLSHLARRAGIGLGRTGSTAHYGSGEIFVAFATARDGDRIPDNELNGFFTAAIDATEEAVLNSLWAAPDVIGREGRVERGLPHEPVLELLRERKALD
jgi:D-aminopeptidase